MDKSHFSQYMLTMIWMNAEIFNNIFFYGNKITNIFFWSAILI